MTVAVKAKNRVKDQARRAGKNQATIFDRRKYADLLARALPMVIASEAEYDETLAAIKRLLRKGEANLSPEEDRLLDLLSTLAENWEEAHHPIPEAPSHRILQHYMLIRGVKQRDLQHILGSRATTSAVVNGKRRLTHEQAQHLATFFDVSPAVFI